MVQKLEWMIPNDGPDVTSIHRIQSAYPDLFVNGNNNNILDSIVCQKRLNVEKIFYSSSVALFDVSQHQLSVTTTTSPKNACTNNPFTIDFAWQLETLVRLHLMLSKGERANSIKVGNISEFKYEGDLSMVKIPVRQQSYCGQAKFNQIPLSLVVSVHILL